MLATPHPDWLSTISCLTAAAMVLVNDQAPMWAGHISCTLAVGGGRGGGGCSAKCTIPHVMQVAELAHLKDVTNSAARRLASSMVCNIPRCRFLTLAFLVTLTFPLYWTLELLSVCGSPWEDCCVPELLVLLSATAGSASLALLSTVSKCLVELAGCCKQSQHDSGAGQKQGISSPNHAHAV